MVLSTAAEEAGEASQWRAKKGKSTASKSVKWWERNPTRNGAMELAIVYAVRCIMRTGVHEKGKGVNGKGQLWADAVTEFNKSIVPNADNVKVQSMKNIADTLENACRTYLTEEGAWTGAASVTLNGQTLTEVEKNTCKEYVHQPLFYTPCGH
jgi:hypothetical protein